MLIGCVAHERKKMKHKSFFAAELVEDRTFLEQMAIHLTLDCQD